MYVLVPFYLKYRHMLWKKPRNIVHPPQAVEAFHVSRVLSYVLVLDAGMKYTLDP